MCQTLFGVVNADKLREVRMTIAKGLGKRAMEVYISNVEKIAAKEEPTQELKAMMAGADFMPMVSETVSYRYSCRRSECRIILLREAQWVIGKPASGGEPMWFCAACGKQYTHGIKASKDLVSGQDLACNYIVFYAVRGEGRRTHVVRDGGGARRYSSEPAHHAQAGLGEFRTRDQSWAPSLASWTW